MPTIVGGLSRARKIRVDDALSGAAPRRRSALCQRGIVAFDGLPKYAEGLQADWIIWIISLSSQADVAVKAVAIANIIKAGTRIKASSEHYKLAIGHVAPRKLLITDWSACGRERRHWVAENLACDGSTIPSYFARPVYGIP
jgi:hypothetical protein